MARRISACRPLRAAVLLPAMSLHFSFAVADCRTLIVEAPDHLAFSGCITSMTAQGLIRVIEANPDHPLVVRSEGGAVNAALDVARVMARNRTRLIVRGQCLSACANYWVPAAATVEVESNAVIGFHGDAQTTYRDHAASISTEPLAREGIQSVVDLEERVGKEIPAIGDVHTLQAIRTSKSPLAVSYRGSSLRCDGLGRSAVWTPSLQRLASLALVARLTSRNVGFAPSIESSHDDNLLTASNDDSDPLASCVSAERP